MEPIRIEESSNVIRAAMFAIRVNRLETELKKARFQLHDHALERAARRTAGKKESHAEQFHYWDGKVKGLEMALNIITKGKES